MSVPTLVPLAEVQRVPDLIRTRLARRLARRVDRDAIRGDIVAAGEAAALAIEAARGWGTGNYVQYAWGTVRIERVDLLCREPKPRADGLHGWLRVQCHGAVVEFWLPWLFTEGV